MDVAERMIRLAGLRPGQDIEIKIVGARPGEKLFEELFDRAEQRRPSSIIGVDVAIPTRVPLAVLNAWIPRLQAAAVAGDADTVVDLLRELVPGYQPVGWQRLAPTESLAAVVA